MKSSSLFWQLQPSVRAELSGRRVSLHTFGRERAAAAESHDCLHSVRYNRRVVWCCRKGVVAGARCAAGSPRLRLRPRWGWTPCCSACLEAEKTWRPPRCRWSWSLVLPPRSSPGKRRELRSEDVKKKTCCRYCHQCLTQTKHHISCMKRGATSRAPLISTLRNESFTF